MKAVLTICLAAFFTTTAAAQGRQAGKPRAKAGAATEKAAAKKAATARKRDALKEDFDVNFRHQVERTRNSIYTLGGRLVPAGRKRGEGC